MSLQTRLEALVAAIGADIKTLTTRVNSVSASSYPWQEQVLTTAYTNSTTTATDVFPGFAPAANTRYIVDVFASVTAAAATTGVQVALSGQTFGVTAAVKIISASSATTDMISHVGINSFQATTAGLTTPTLISVQALIENSAANATTLFRLQAKSEVAGSAITIRPGSSMRWRTI